ncbi:MAG: four helix bundle protein, partial [Actinomycetota bacterium]
MWQKAHKLFLETVEDVNKFPKNKVADILAQQLLRSVSSISANIAEGFGKNKGKEFQRYSI